MIMTKVHKLLYIFLIALLNNNFGINSLCDIRMTLSDGRTLKVERKHHSEREREKEKY